MNSTSFFDFFYSIQKITSPPSVMIAHGFYEFLGEMLIRELAASYLKGKNELNFKRLYLDGEEDHSWEEIFAQLQKNVLFFQNQRLVILVIRDERKLSLKISDKESIRQYLDGVNPSSPLFIFISLDLLRDDYRQLRKSKLEGFLKAFDHEKVVMIDLDKISQNQIKYYIKDYFKERGITITSSAIERIMEVKSDDFCVYSERIAQT